MNSVTIFKKTFFLFTFLVLVLPRIYAEPNVTSPQNSKYNISADLLVWLASEEVASIWADMITTGDKTSWEAPSFDFAWDLGFRIGIGYNLSHDQWDTVLTWTWFHTDAKHTLSSKPNVSLHPEFFAAFLSGDSPKSMRANWNLFLNMFNWELGRYCWISKDFSLRPFVGIKGGWIDQAIHTKYYDVTIDLFFPTTNSGKEFLKNNFWGLGPLVGINAKWRALNLGSHFFDILGDFSFATMWGSWFCSDTYKNTLFKTSSVNTKKSTLGAIAFQGFLGIGWNIDFHKGKSHFATKIGYEMQLFANQLRFATFQLQRLHDDLTLQGITLNCRWDF